ncbi:MAG: manganese efflux pump MntP family protein [Candidatus Kapaibacterium sp.]
MEIVYLVFLGIGLSIDSFTASLSTGICMPLGGQKRALYVAFVMSFFQGIMPFIGWMAGKGLEQHISAFDHWIAFVMLSAIGIKMIHDSFSKNYRDECACPSRPAVLFSMAIATSIDALIVGIGLGLVGADIYSAVFFIGMMTFIFSYGGIWLGRRLGNRIKFRFEVIGGIILIGLGLKILIEHLNA